MRLALLFSFLKDLERFGGSISSTGLDFRDNGVLWVRSASRLDLDLDDCWLDSELATDVSVEVSLSELASAIKSNFELCLLDLFLLANFDSGTSSMVPKEALFECPFAFLFDLDSESDILASLEDTGDGSVDFDTLNIGLEAERFLTTATGGSERFCSVVDLLDSFFNLDSSFGGAESVITADLGEFRRAIEWCSSLESTKLEAISEPIACLGLFSDSC